tara:strand:- start:79 stop:468 length:390 start_codon:yes stop_codon:yes gene_type:complete
MKVNPDNKCVFLKGIDFLESPVRHGEGKLIAMNNKVLDEMKSKNLITLWYADAEGNPTMDYPANPNGSTDAIAGVCNESGRVFGLMPHPEAFIYTFNHPRWTRGECSGEEGAGMKIFRNAVEFAEENLL